MSRLLILIALAVLVIVWRASRPHWPEPVTNSPSRTVFTFPDGTVGPGDWDPKTGTVVPSSVTAWDSEPWGDV